METDDFKTAIKFLLPSDQVKNLEEFISVSQERGHPMGERKPLRKNATQLHHTTVSEHTAVGSRGH